MTSKPSAEWLEMRRAFERELSREIGPKQVQPTRYLALRQMVDAYVAKLEAELGDVRRRLGGYSDSRLDGDGGLAAATLAEVERLRASKDRAYSTFDPFMILPGEYEVGGIIRDAAEHDPTQMRFYLKVSIGELAQRICRALNAGGDDDE